MCCEGCGYLWMIGELFFELIGIVVFLPLGLDKCVFVPKLCKDIHSFWLVYPQNYLVFSSAFGKIPVAFRGSIVTSSVQPLRMMVL